MKNINLSSLIILLIVTSFFSVADAQKNSKKDDKPEPDPHLTQKDNDYLDRQDRAFLDTVMAVLSQYPPVRHDGRERTGAKLLMDAVCHDEYAAFRKPVQEFFHARVGKVINELENTKVTKGAVIWKVYNMGFIVRTSSVTIAFDLVSGITSGSKGFAMTSEETDRLVRQCDVLFISHKHNDHAEKDIAEKFLGRGCPVVAPEQVWKGDKISAKITHPDRIPEKVQELGLSGKRKLDIIVYPGHQMTSADVNVVLVKTAEGITIAHLGDQINEGSFMADFAWIDNVSKKNKVDIMIPNCWTNDVPRIAKGFNPQLIMPGHELELGHSLSDRYPFWGDDEYLGLKYRELKKSKYPVVVMVWGESYHYYTDQSK